eukprot:gene32557-40170_t
MSVTSGKFAGFFGPGAALSAATATTSRRRLMYATSDLLSINKTSRSTADSKLSDPLYDLFPFDGSNIETVKKIHSKRVKMVAKTTWKVLHLVRMAV